MNNPFRHLVTLGGGGFLMEPAPNALDNYLLRLTKKRKPRVCFIPTASGEWAPHVEKFHAAFSKGRAAASSLRLVCKSVPDDPAMLLEQDLIYVGGGSTVNLLAIWRAHGVDRVLRRRWKRGNVVFAGVSAGMNCWYAGCSTDSFGPLAPLNDGLGFIPAAACPHLDAEAERRPTLTKWVSARKLPTTYAADDYAALYFTAAGARLKPQLHRCIASRVSAGCYRVERRGRGAWIEPLPTRRLRHDGRLTAATAYA